WPERPHASRGWWRLLVSRATAAGSFAHGTIGNRYRLDIRGQPPSRLTAVADTAGFVLLHVACAAVVLVGGSIQAAAIAAVTYATLCFGIAAGSPGSSSNRSFGAGRVVQFVLGLPGTLALQKGVLGGVTPPRRHHAVADTPADVH